MNWDHIKYFIATARAGSLTLAAQVLSSSPATLSRRLDALEHDCGMTLFTRTNTGYSLTRDGEVFLSRCLDIEDAFRILERSWPSAAPGPAGTVRIATSENWANLILLPAMRKLRQIYPHIEVVLQTGPQPIPLRGREVDLAVRLSMPSSGNFKARCIGLQAHALYAARVSQSNGSEPIIGWPNEYAALPIAKAAGLHPKYCHPPPLQVDTLQGHVAAARAGVGCAYLPCFVGDTVPELMRIDGPCGLLKQKIYLILHNDSVEMQRVRVVADFIVETFRLAAPRLDPEDCGGLVDVPTGDDTDSSSSASTVAGHDPSAVSSESVCAVDRRQR
jgi:DNA-binding transcriptional LysR family regulator